MLMSAQRNKLVYLTGVGVLPTGVGGLRCGSAVCWGAGGCWELAAGVGCVAGLVSAEPSSAGRTTVGLLGGRRRMLWRPLLVQLNSFTNCKQTTITRRPFSPPRRSWKESELHTGFLLTD